MGYASQMKDSIERRYRSLFSVVTYSMLIHRCLDQGLACTVVALAGRVMERQRGGKKGGKDAFQPRNKLIKTTGVLLRQAGRLSSSCETCACGGVSSFCAHSVVQRGRIGRHQG